MASVSSAIKVYISDYISLNRPDITKAVNSREWFLKRLKNVIRTRTQEPILFSPDPFVYFGSYFKGTKVKAVDEYDVIVVIDSNTGIFSSGGIETGVGLGYANPNYKYSPRFYKYDNNGISPAKLLNWLKGVVKEVTDSFSGETPERNGQAITALIKSLNLKIDLVPAGIFEQNSDGSIFYNIPKGDKDGGWIVTSPREDIELLNGVARGKDNFRNIIRIAKRIKDTYNFGVTSFAIETAIVSYGCSSYWFNDLYFDTCSVLEHLSYLFKEGTISDSYDSSKNLIEGVSSLLWYAYRIDKIVAVLNECYEMENQNLAKNMVERAFENEL